MEGKIGRRAQAVVSGSNRLRKGGKIGRMEGGKNTGRGEGGKKGRKIYLIEWLIWGAYLYHRNG